MTEFKNQALQKGFKLGVYEIRDLIRSNPLSLTYLAWNQHLNTLVTLEEYFPSQYAQRSSDGHTVKSASGSEGTQYDDGLSGFMEKSEILTEIQHPSILGAHNLLQFNETAYLSMDYESDGSVATLDEDYKTLSQTELQQNLHLLLDGLKQLHERGFFIGDIQPANIFIKNGKLLFSNISAALFTITSLNNKVTRTLPAAYTAPELYDSPHLPGPATDLYSLGATIYRCFMGVEPVASLERIRALHNNTPDPLPLASDSSSSEFATVIDELLMTDPEKRPQSALNVSVALNRIESEHHSGITSTGHGNYETLIPESEKNKPGIWWPGGVLAIIALFAFAIWYLFQSGEEPIQYASNSPATVSSQESTIVEPSEPVMEVEIAEAEAEAEPPATVQPLPDSAKASSPVNLSTASSEQKADQTIENRPDDLTTSVLQPESVEPTETFSDDPAPENVASMETETVEIETPEVVAVETIPPIPSPQQESPAISPATKNELIIQDHLAAAETDFSSLRLTTPAETNALQHYNAILDIDPDNLDAQQGLQKIVDLYVYLIDKAILEGDRDLAQVYFDRADVILPDDPGIRRLRSEISNSPVQP